MHDYQIEVLEAADSHAATSELSTGMALMSEIHYSLDSLPVRTTQQHPSLLFYHSAIAKSSLYSGGMLCVWHQAALEDQEAVAVCTGFCHVDKAAAPRRTTIAWQALIPRESARSHVKLSMMPKIADALYGNCPSTSLQK
jgi:hypothetical protein